MARKKDDRHQRKDQGDASGSGSPPPGTSGTGGEEKKGKKKGRREEEDAYLASNEEHFARFKAQLSPLGLMLRDIQGDGNCLFRALGDQLEGHGVHHFKHRMDTVRYMIQHRSDFEPFIDEGLTFENYVDSLSRAGTYAGQDSLVAFARARKVNIVIHQLNSPLWQIEGGVPGCPELHLSYHNGEHYSSVRREGDQSLGAANVRMGHSLLISKSDALSLPKSAAATTAPAAALWALDSATEGESAVEDSGAETLAPPPQPSSPSNGEVVVEDLESLVAYVMEQAECQDGVRARECLLAHGLNPELTIDYLLNLQLFANQPPRLPDPPPDKPIDKPKSKQKVGKRAEAGRVAGSVGVGSTPPAFHCLNL